MPLMSADELAQHYFLLGAAEVTYTRRTGTTPDYNAGTVSEAETEYTITVLRGTLDESADSARRLQAGERMYTALRGSDVVMGDDTIRALPFDPKVGDTITDAGKTFAVTDDWNLINDNQQVSMICQQLS